MAKKPTPETPAERENREFVETIARNLITLARSVKALINGPLNRRALVILLASSSGIPQVKVGEVLKALENLEKDWLNK